MGERLSNAGTSIYSMRLVMNKLSTFALATALAVSFPAAGIAQNIDLGADGDVSVDVGGDNGLGADANVGVGADAGTGGADVDADADVNIGIGADGGDDGDGGASGVGTDAGGPGDDASAGADGTVGGGASAGADGAVEGDAATEAELDADVEVVGSTDELAALIGTMTSADFGLDGVAMIAIVEVQDLPGSTAIIEESLATNTEALDELRAGIIADAAIAAAIEDAGYSIDDVVAVTTIGTTATVYVYDA